VAITKCSWDYNDWCKRQADAIEATMRVYAARGCGSDAAFWLIPCTETSEGRLVLAEAKPDGATDVVRLAPHQSWRSMPYSHVYHCVYGACRRVPIIPANAWSDYRAA